MNGSVQVKGKEADSKKPAASIDDIIDKKIDPLFMLINQHTQKTYSDFNVIVQKMMLTQDKLEADLSSMVQVLWGIVNQATAREAALESLLIKNGLSLKELDKEYKDIIDKMKNSGDWNEVSLDAIAENVTGPVVTEPSEIKEVPEGAPPPPKNPAPKG